MALVCTITVEQLFAFLFYVTLSAVPWGCIVLKLLIKWKYTEFKWELIHTHNEYARSLSRSQNKVKREVMDFLVYNNIWLFMKSK